MAKNFKKEMGTNNKRSKLRKFIFDKFSLYKPDNRLLIFLLKINYEKLDNISKEKISEKSVWIKNFIDPKIGNAKIYKSKKRLELRLKPKEFIKNKSFLNFKIENKVNTKNLREIFINKNKKNKYLLKETKKIKKFFSKLKD